MPVNAVRLNHAVLFVADLEGSLAFYQRVFGMTVVAQEPRASAAFLRLPPSGNHHDLGLFGVGQSQRAPGSIGHYHLAWQVDTIEDLQQARATLAELGALTGESSHGATKSLYGRDPDGNELRSCGCCPRRTGAPTRTRHRSSASTSRASSPGGPACPLPPNWSLRPSCITGRRLSRSRASPLRECWSGTP